MSDATSAEAMAELAEEFARRYRAGERPDVEEYALKNPALADQIRELLPVMLAMELATPDLVPEFERPGVTVDRYKLLERIGEGGFGVVYMAEQQHPVRRRVALKVVKPGMDSRQVLSRFEAERQALAIMDHPNIARVFDGGMTESGRPFFVMELVKGEPITSYCDGHQLPARQRLELFVQVCHAVQHAHQKGIIHRDIKPSNVLVTTHDTTPVIKVIDFGVAKALGQELTDHTLFTGFAQLVGTPLYMSPEQAGQSSLDVDTRSDIYSLGVLLYELLTGTTPFNKERFNKAAQEEIRRVIREEEPPRPSTRLRESKESLASISAMRRTEPAKLTRLVRGELDWIVMKTLEKDRNRRYETANAFAADLLRYLHNEPVLACPPSASYRLRKFVRRNRAAAGVAALVLFLLMLLGSGMGWAARDRSARQAKATGQVELILSEVAQLQRNQQWPEALASARRAEAVVAGGDADGAAARRAREQLKDLEFVERLEEIRMQYSTWLRSDFDNRGTDRSLVDAFSGYGVAVDELAIDKSIQHLKSRPELVIPVAMALDLWIGIRRNLQDDAGRQRLLAIVRGIDPNEVRNRIRAALEDPEAGDELRRLAESIDIQAQHPGTLGGLAHGLKKAKQLDASLQLRRKAQAVHPQDFWLNYNLGVALHEQKDYLEAIRFYTAAVAVRPNAVAALHNLGVALSDQQRLDEAIALFRRALEIDSNFAYCHNSLGVALRLQKKYEDAIAAYRKAIEADPDYSTAYANLGSVLGEQNQIEGAIAAYRKAIELGMRDPVVYNNLGNGLFRQGKLNDAIPAYHKAIELDPTYTLAYENLGAALLDQGKPDEAIAIFRKAIEDDRKASEDAYRGIAQALRTQRKLDDAIATLNTAIELIPTSAALYNDLGATREEQKKPEQAVEAYRKAIAVNPSFAFAYSNLGTVLMDQGRESEAAAVYNKAIELHPNDASFRFNLGLLFQKLKETQKAVDCFRKAIELSPNDPGFHYSLGISLAELKDHRNAVASLRKVIELDPNSPLPRDTFAWLLATCSAPEFRDPVLALTHARKATEIDPANPRWANTLGVVYYRNRDWRAAIAALERSIELGNGGNCSHWFFLAMSHWQMGDREEARRWYAQAIREMDARPPAHEDWLHFRKEAAELLGDHEQGT